MFCETNIRVDPKAQTIPRMLPFVENEDEQASMTPNVSGNKDR